MNNFYKNKIKLQQMKSNLKLKNIFFKLKNFFKMKS